MSDQNIPPVDPEDENWDDSFGDFLDGLESEEAVLDPNECVQIRSTGGGHYQVLVEEPMPISEVLRQANLTVSQGIEYWVNNVAVAPDFVVGPGTIVTAVGMVKGG
jgi:hypothetical protein